MPSPRTSKKQIRAAVNKGINRPKVKVADQPGQTKDLTNKQRAFIAEYLVDFNASAAARRVGYAPQMAQLTSVWVTKNKATCPPKYHHVWEAAHAAIEAHVESIKVTREDVLRMLFEMANADISQAVDADGRLLPVNQMPKAVARMVGGFEQDFEDIPQHDKQGRPVDKDGNLCEKSEKPQHFLRTYRTTKVRLWDRPKVIQMLGQHVDVQAFKEQIDANVKGSVTLEMVNYILPA